MSALHISEQLEKARVEAGELERRLADPKVFAQPDYPQLAQRYSRLKDLIRLGEEWEGLKAAIAEMEELRQTEDDLREELDEELDGDRRRLEELERRFRLLLRR